MKRESNHHIFLSPVVFGKSVDYWSVVVAIEKTEELPWRKPVQEIDKLAAFCRYFGCVVTDCWNLDGPGVSARNSGQPFL